MVQYATAAELASYLQQDVDTATANQALTLASHQFSMSADTWFAPTPVTYQVPGDGCRSLRLPFWPVIAVLAVRVAGTTVPSGDYTLIRDVLYRRTGTFGTPMRFPPDLVEVDLSHGYATASDDVKLGVLQIAAESYANPVGAVVSESIDDYTVRYDGRAIAASGRHWSDIAAGYRGPFAA